MCGVDARQKFEKMEKYTLFTLPWLKQMNLTFYV